MRLYRETRAAIHFPWVTQVIAEGDDLEGLQKEAFAAARREGLTNHAGNSWTWDTDDLGGNWLLQYDEHNCFFIRAH
jgi:hypothetical protein